MAHLWGRESKVDYIYIVTEKLSINKFGYGDIFPKQLRNWQQKQQQKRTEVTVSPSKWGDKNSREPLAGAFSALYHNSDVH